ncbi:hypothetical protein SCHPADRAFT_433397 [Schizopora paradoxa]|uniref:DUF7223 domain-containing protein n=1 Tax=Schizopora paradoxa TaxID=27342 RepID=A0A0H2RJV6_9AGAM|nr:hypothetical protein SCHPADRAFT_433397 [Schizopora paradoxa]
MPYIRPAWKRSKYSIHPRHALCSMKSTTSLLLLPLFILRVQSKDDWTTPCLSGSCSFDIARSGTSLAATLVINGSPSSISDITPAAGWTVLNCTSSTNTQTIQIACVDESKACEHLFQDGAENTIVRLPQSCGAGPFARVAKHSIAMNQTLSDKDTFKVKWTDGSTPQIQLLQIDTEFGAAASSERTVGFSLIASSDPHVSGNSGPLSATKSRRHQSSNSKRLSVPPISNPGPTAFNDSATRGQSISFDKSFVLFNDTLSCAGIEEPNLKVDVEADVDFTTSLNILAAGTLIPPAITMLEITTTIDGSFEAMLSLDSGLTGTLSTGEITLLSIGLPGLTIPNVLTIGPQFVLLGEIEGTINLVADSNIGVQYDLDGLSFTVGNTERSSPGFTPRDSPIQFSIDPSISADAELEVHIIPQYIMGIASFGDAVDVVANLDSGLGIMLNTTILEDLVSLPADESVVGSADAMACADIFSSTSFSVSATGNLLGIIDNSLSIPILEKTFDIYQNCLEETMTETAARSGLSTRLEDASIVSWTERTQVQRRNSRRAGRQASSLFARALSCPPASQTTFAPIGTSTDVPAA